jgi:carbonic anhydrase/acetyltransferase-like protein (isoleucine patch superfamily)
MSNPDAQQEAPGHPSALIRPYGDTWPTIDPAAWLAPTATVIGTATVEDEASVFYGAVVRADMDQVRLGRGSNLQDNVVVHTDAGFPTLIGSGVSVGHAGVVHGCQIADDVLVGMGATILNGASIGSQTLIAAGTVVLEGTVIPPRSLVAGVPGKVRRELTDAEVDKVVQNAQHYVWLSGQHRQIRD